MGVADIDVDQTDPQRATQAARWHRTLRGLERIESRQEAIAQHVIQIETALVRIEAKIAKWEPIVDELMARQPARFRKWWKENERA